MTVVGTEQRSMDEGGPEPLGHKKIDGQAVVVDLILVASVVYFLVMALGYGEVVRRAPAVTLGIMLGLLLLDLALIGARVMRGLPPLAVAERMDAPIVYQLLHILGFIACGILMYTVGYRLATPIFLTIFLIVMRASWKVTVPMVVFFSGFFYFVFSFVFNVR